MNNAAISNDALKITVTYSYLDEDHVRVSNNRGAVVVMTNDEAKAHRERLLASGGRES